MEWVIVNPSSIHEVCGLLGHASSTGDYHVKRESCSDALDELLTKLISDGPSLRTRRSLGLSQVISKDLIPLLTAASTEHPKVVPKLIKLLSFLTSPIECLISAEFITTEEGQQVAYEVECLLRAIKVKFTEFKVTKAVVGYLKNVTGKIDILTPEECGGVSDGLLLLRNILHIPNKEPGTQHQILWNLFAHSIDKILLHLMTCEQKNLWGIALVQLIALIYKDQHVANLQKLLNLWLENSISESSEDMDNESNTSPPDHSSSPTLTSDPTSDSSDTGGNAKNKQGANNENVDILESSTLNKEKIPMEIIPIIVEPLANINLTIKTEKGLYSNSNGNNASHNITSERMSSLPVCIKIDREMNQSGNQKAYTKAKSKKAKITNSSQNKERMSDVDSGISSSHFSTEKINSMGDDQHESIRGHGSFLEKQLSYNQQMQQDTNSTSSNDDDSQRPTAIASVTLKQRGNKLSSHGVKLVPQLRNNSILSAQDKREMKRKKLHKRSKRTKTCIKAFVHHNPTEEDISHVLREFTVDFLLKGYGSLVAVLQEQLSLNASLQMDKSHFLWLITYFLKFASQMELDLEHISPVLSNKILSYLTYEGVAMCENLAICKDDLKPHLRRMHLVVTALREFVQAVEIYSKLPSCSLEDKHHISELQNQLLSVEELRHLLLLLIRYFKPGVQSKQYLQDLIITNHVFLLLLEKISCNEDYTGDFKMFEYVKEFSSPLIMQQYGHLLEDFKNNGEFVNDCVFTMMHHIAGDLGRPEALYQPLILKTFSSIWEMEFEIKDDWADLIEYVIQRFMKASNEEKRQIFKSGTSNVSDDVGWSKEDFNNLCWYYTKCSTSSDPIAKILELYGDAQGKTRKSILNQLLHQRIIGYNQFLLFLASERVETGDSDGAATDGSCSSGTSSSHATAGSSCHSLPPSSPVDENYGFSNGDPFPFETKIESNISETDPTNNHDETDDNFIFINDKVNKKPIDMDGSPIRMNGVSKKSQSVINTGLSESTVPMEVANMEIAVRELINQITGEGHDLCWLQNQVLEACNVKFRMELKQQRIKRSKINRYDIESRGYKRREDFEDEFSNVGPIAYHYSLLGQSIPIIPWTHWQEILLMSPPYLLLLHKLGFHLPGDVGKLFPRIPHFWTSDVLLSVAGKLGPLPAMDKMKFDPKEIIQSMEIYIEDIEESSFSGSKVSSPDVPTNGVTVNSKGIASSEEPEFNMPTMGVGNSFMSPHTSYGFGSATHSVNWMTLVHKSKQLIDRHSEPVDTKSMSSSSDEEEEQMDDCVSLKALPPTDHSEITMMSQESGDEDRDNDDEEGYDHDPAEL